MARDSEGFDTDLVRVAVTGTIYKGAPGTDIPAAGAPTGSAWTPLGTFTEDGVEHGFSEDTQEIPSWQRGIVRVVIKGRKLTLKLSALESSPAVLGDFYGSVPVVDETTKTVTVPIAANAVRPKQAYLFEFVDDDAVWRLYLPTAQVSEVESPKFTSGDAVTWGMTIQAIGSSDNLGEWQIDDPDFYEDAGGADSANGLVGQTVEAGV
ncbi:hypothetical protein [Microtetraspora malaysiensis]|uniref:phage tail tube protein n=1 Tax=Microtetraspora malaysiensis TaxID=161358 RepID=UPI003D8CE966